MVQPVVILIWDGSVRWLHQGINSFVHDKVFVDIISKARRYTAVWSRECPIQFNDPEVIKLPAG